MNFEGAKENIQPLAAGRNVEQLEVALNAESHPEYQEELLQQRKQFEHDIAHYVGDDPLDLWFDYVTWVEQSYPKSGKESALDDLLKTCLSKFERDDRYKQDVRYIRLFIKYIDTKEKRNLYYTKLYNSGVGTMVADLYIAWAHHFDITDNFDEAQKIFQKGLDARAAPIEQLKQVYERFQMSVSQRILRKDAYRQEFLTTMEEQRHAFTSLRSLKRSKVGSIRTGSAVRSYIPGQVQQNQPTSSMSTNAPLPVYEGASNMNEKTQPQRFTSVVMDIQNSMVENKIEPGPWTKASNRKSVFHNTTERNSTLKFAILEDVDVQQPPIKFGPLPPDNGNLAINLPPDFVRKSRPQTPFNVPAYVEDSLPPLAIPCYDIFFLQPNKKASFSTEELRWYKRCKIQNIENAFKKEQDKIWSTDTTVPMRLPPRFVRKNQPFVDMETERPDILSIPKTENFLCKLTELYPKDSTTDVSIEELYRQKYISKSNNDGMDETICVRGRQSFGVKHIRKSIVTGGRKSIMPLANDKGSVTLNLPSTISEDSSSDMEIDDGEEGTHRNEMEFGKSDTINTNVQSNQPLYNHQSNSAATASAENVSVLKSNSVAIASAENVGVSKSNSAALASAENVSVLKQNPVPKWSIFNDESSNALPTTPTDDEPKSKITEKLPVPSWSIFKDDDASSPTIFSSISKTVDPDKTKDVFAVPQRPLSGSSTLAEKRTLEWAMKSADIETPDLKRTILERPQHTIGPHTGAIKKVARKSFIAENAIQKSQSPPSSTSPSSNNENTFKSPNPLDPKKFHESMSLDYSLCTQKFNFNLAEQMVSTPVATRRIEALTEQIRAQDAQPIQPLKSLSTIMETTEGSAHTASTKSSTQFSSPEDDDLSKQSKLLNRTKFVGGVTIGSDSDGSESGDKNDFKSEAIKEFTVNSFVNPNVVVASTNYSCNVEKTLPTIQMSLLLEGAAAIHNKNDITAPAKDGPAKNFPFPIFEDTQATITDVNTTKSQPKSTLNESLLNFFSVTPDPQCLPTTSIPSAPALHTTGPLESSSYELQNATHSNDVRFNMPSMWIKDEPHSFTLHDSATEESFAIPSVRESESVAQPSGETVNEFDIVELHQTKDKLVSFTLNDSATEESFAIPNVRQTESVAKPNRTNVGSNTFDLDDSSDSEEEIILVPDETLCEDIPKIAQVQSLAQPNQNDISESCFGVDTRISISISEDEAAAHCNIKQEMKNIPNADATLADAANCDQSIYFKHNSILIEPSWIENEGEQALPEEFNIYQHEKVNLEESRIFIETKLAEPAIDPFDEQLRKAILQELAFIFYLEEHESTLLVNAAPPVTVKSMIPFKDNSFDVLKCIGHGAYGRVYNVKSVQDGAMYAVKKEMPPNTWECFILREVHQRVVENMLSGYMKIDLAIIGNNASLLFSEYSPYGTLLDICNRVFTSIQNNVNETIVYILAYQMLELIDHLHKADILHLDVKPDNFLVMKHMSTNPDELFIQLIDFGNAIDLQQYPAGQQFNAALETKHFICIEMVENRPWIYQPDLYCLAGTIHSVLFGKYMDVQKDGLGYDIKLKIPRYNNRTLWSRFFKELINVNEQSQPDLQGMKKCFYDAIITDKNLEKKIKEFNRFIVEKPK